MIITGITLSGPVLAGLAIWLDTPWLFWVGVALAVFNLFMDLVSGATRFPFLEIAFMLAGVWFWTPWWMGAALGLLVVTAIGAVAALFGWRRSRV